MLTSLLVIVLAAPAFSYADEPALGTLKTIVAPNPSVTADCDPTYKDQMGKFVAQQWENCGKIGQLEPSVCQRRLFDYCVRSSRLLADETTKTCAEVTGAGAETLNANGTVDSQRSSDQSGEAVNIVAALKTNAYIARLRENGRAFSATANEGKQLALSPACRQSTAAAAYSGISVTLANTPAAATKFIADLLGKKQENYSNLVKSSATLRERIEGMKTAGVKVEGDALKKKEQIISRAAKIPLVATSSSLAPARLLGFPGTGGGPVVPEMPDAYFRKPIGKEFSRFARGGQNGAASAAAKRRPAKGGAISPLMEVPAALNPDELVLATPGAKIFSALNIRVDSTFTDRQRLIIARGYTLIPSCRRQLLVNGSIRKEKQEPGFYGSLFMKDHGIQNGNIRGEERYWMILDPSYPGGLQVAMVVHELYHGVSFAKNEELLKQFRKYQEPVKDNRANCPVSPYAKTNIDEDFAEAATQVHFPKGGEGGFNPAPCAREKVQRLKAILAC